MATPQMPPTRPRLHVQAPSYSNDIQVDPNNEKAAHDHDRLEPNPHPHDVISHLSPTTCEDREAANRLNDDLELLRAERVVSREDRAAESRRSRDRSHQDRVEDAFNTDGPPALSKPPPKKETWATKFWFWLKKFPRALRYVLYAIPPTVLILIPVFLDLFVYDRNAKPVGGNGGVKLLWFGIWLEVVWLSLWVTRMLAAIMPFTFGLIANTVGSSDGKKWHDIGSQLEFPTALFLWLLAVLCSYHPILSNHRAGDDGEGGIPKAGWIGIVFKIIIALFTMSALNFIEKILIQWIATSFHMRTYSHRIRENQMQIDTLVTLFSYARTQIEAQDPVWTSAPPTAYGTDGSSGTPTPLKNLEKRSRQAWGKVGEAASRMAGDFTGRRILKGDHPMKVVLELLRNTSSSYTLARVFYRTFVKPGKSVITLEDLVPAFPTPEDAEAGFGVFDRDLNGDISMEELELACNEVHLEKKAIAASLKDLDSVIKKLDEVFMFIIVVIVVIVFISILSNSAAAALTSTGTVILGLSWLLQATAQEFLQSIIFVFVKHPFDVGDRVTIYGNTGPSMQGDDYYVLEVSLLYTEFKKMQGHVVQAPNSLLNTLFILNQRRSQGLADPVNLKLRFGTTDAQIEELKARMLAFCLRNKRDYDANIISEVQTIDEVYSVTMNIIFFHKSNYQNELLRLNRHNRFCVELMTQMHDMGLEGPRVVQPGGMRSMPVYWSHVQPPPPPTTTTTTPNDQPPPPQQPQTSIQQQTLSQSDPPQPQSRPRTNSAAAVVESGMDFGDVYRNRRPDNGSLHRLASMREEPEHNHHRMHRRDSGGATSSLERMHSRESLTAARIGTNGSGAGSRRRWGGGGRDGGGAVGSNAV